MNRSREILEEAIGALEEALRRDPSNGPFFYAMAALLALTGRLQQARECLERAEALGVDGRMLQDWLSRESQLRS
jgi:tetratricopeptide (TPR) repeat protein